MREGPSHCGSPSPQSLYYKTAIIKTFCLSLIQNYLLQQKHFCLWMVFLQIMSGSSYGTFFFLIKVQMRSSSLSNCSVTQKKTQWGNMEVSVPLSWRMCSPWNWPALHACSAGSGVPPSGFGLGSSAAVCPPDSSPALPRAVSVPPSFLTVAAKTKENSRPLMLPWSN